MKSKLNTANTFQNAKVGDIWKYQENLVEILISNFNLLTAKILETKENTYIYRYQDGEYVGKKENFPEYFV